MNDAPQVKRSPPAKITKGAIFWMAFPIALLAVSSTAWLIMVSIAVNDPGFAVERDYYKKASNFDDVIAQRAENARVGWEASVESFDLDRDGAAALLLILKDAEGQPITGAKVRLEAFQNARAAQLQEASFTETSAGAYRVRLEQPRLGLWEFRIVAERDQIFTQVLRAELFAAQEAAPPS